MDARCPNCGSVFDVAQPPVTAQKPNTRPGRRLIAALILGIIGALSVAMICVTVVAISYLNRRPTPAPAPAPESGSPTLAANAAEPTKPKAPVEPPAPPENKKAKAPAWPTLRGRPGGDRSPFERQARGGIPVTDSAFQKNPASAIRESSPFSPEETRNDPLPAMTTVHQPIMQRAEKDVQFNLPRLRLASRPNDNLSISGGAALSLDEIKKAVVYIIVNSLSANLTGSGFVFRVENDTALIATNHHVIEPAWTKKMLEQDEPVQVTVVFDSGTANERTATAEVISADSDVDLAILRVRGVRKLPQPIDPGDAPRPRETMNVLLCGYPLGSALATGGRHPAITVGKGAVSSVRLDSDGEVAVVQIEGELNPGNSGGPAVDEDGRLVGIIVAKIVGTGIGLAIPPAELTSLLTGRVGAPHFLAKVDQGQLGLMAIAPLMDPLRNIRSASMHYLQLDEGAEPRFDASARGWNVMPNSQRATFVARGDVAHSFARLPLRDKMRTYVQISYVREDGQTVASRPVPYLIGSETQRVVTGDVIAMNDFNRFPEKYGTQPVFVRGRIFGGAVGKGDQYYLQVQNDKGAKPGNLDFRISHEVATQLGELPLFEQTTSCIFTCRLGVRNRGSTDVWVTRITLIDKNNVALKLIPATGSSGDIMVDVNRRPGDYIGQTVTGTGQIIPTIIGRGGTKEMYVFNRLGAKVGNLNFHTSNEIATQLTDEGLPHENIPARLTFRVGAEKERTSHKATVLKIELLDPQGRVKLTIE